jgi:hypothetical protein
LWPMLPLRLFSHLDDNNVKLHTPTLADSGNFCHVP